MTYVCARKLLFLYGFGPLFTWVLVAESLKINFNQYLQCLEKIEKNKKYLSLLDMNQAVVDSTNQLPQVFFTK